MKTKSFLSTAAVIFIIFGSSVFTFASTKSGNDSTPQDQEVFMYISPGAVISGENNIYFAKTEAVIYVSPNTIIYGAENVSNAKIIKASKAIVEKENTIDHKKILGISKEFVVSDKPQDQSVQQLQDRLKRKVNTTFYTSTANQEYYRWVEIILSKQISSHNSTCYKAISTLYTSNKEYVIIPQVIKHNFYNSLCFLSFSKIRNDVLRGPPSDLI